jgi:hypothetical protein
LGKGPKVNQSSVNTQANLQGTETNLLNQYAGIAMPGIQSSQNYWESLLHGGPAAQAATAPYAQTIAQQTAANQKNIQNTLPSGGEKNLALAQNQTGMGQSIANLYQGLGPQAAQQLGNLSLGAGGVGNQGAGVGAQAGGSLLNLAGQQAQAKGQMWGGIGSGVGSLMGGKLGSGGSLLGSLGSKGGGAGANTGGGYGNAS